ncbi:MAG: signal peptidase II [Nitrospirota bacterium]
MKKTAYVSLIVLAVIALDQITKLLIIQHVSPFESIRVLPFFHIVHVENTGAAFGSFRGLGSGFFIAVSVAAICFVIYLLTRNAYSRVGLSLVLGGAIGNLIDRLLYGKVIDFLDFFAGSFHWPAFNVADSALTVGISVILLTALLRK